MQLSCIKGVKMLLIQIVLLLIYWIAPLPVKTVMLAGDIFITDPIPVVDELIMTVMFFDKIQKVFKASEFIRKHKVLVTIATIAVVVLIVFFMYIILSE